MHSFRPRSSSDENADEPPASSGVRAAAQAGDSSDILDQMVWQAARLGDEARLRGLLANGGRATWIPPEGSPRGAGLTSLHVAAMEGHGGAVRRLLEVGAPVEKADSAGCTPLHKAAERGHEDVVGQLLGAGAEVNKANDDGWTPLFGAAVKGHGVVVRQLLQAGAEVDKATTGARMTPLIAAAMKGVPGVCECLLEAGAELNYVATGGYTALGMSLAGEKRDAALFLLRRGASTDGFNMDKLKRLLGWSAEEMDRKDSEVERLSADMERLVQGIPEWCAQAASPSTGTPVGAGGTESSLGSGGKKRKAPTEP